MHTNLNVRDLMERAVHVVGADMPLVELDKEFLGRQLSGFPVVENGQLVGVVSRSDVVRQLAMEQRLAESTSEYYWDREGFHEEPAETIEQIANRLGQRIEDLQVKDLMSRHIVAAAPDDSIEAVAQKLLEHRIHRVPVVDKGRLVGILSTLDFVRLFADRRVSVD